MSISKIMEAQTYIIIKSIVQALSDNSVQQIIKVIEKHKEGLEQKYFVSINHNEGYKSLHLRMNNIHRLS